MLAAVTRADNGPGWKAAWVLFILLTVPIGIVPFLIFGRDRG